jgi:hypothetical protein
MRELERARERERVIYRELGKYRVIMNERGEEREHES